MRVWDAKTCDCLTSFRPPAGGAGAERPVLGVQANPQNLEQLLVCTRSPALFTMTLQGQARVRLHVDGCLLMQQTGRF